VLYRFGLRSGDEECSVSGLCGNENGNENEQTFDAALGTGVSIGFVCFGNLAAT